MNLFGEPFFIKAKLLTYFCFVHQTFKYPRNKKA